MLAALVTAREAVAARGEAGDLVLAYDDRITRLIDDLRPPGARPPGAAGDPAASPPPAWMVAATLLAAAAPLDPGPLKAALRKAAADAVERTARGVAG